MESSGGNGAALAQRLVNLILGVVVTVAMTALFLSGSDLGAANATAKGDPHDAATTAAKAAPARLPSE